jgi:hypothetical protein
MVAIPIGYDQPGTAARIAHHGVGEFIELDELTTERLGGVIGKALQDPSYRERADYFQKVISKTQGLDVAADIIEQAFQKYHTEVPPDSRSVGMSTGRNLLTKSEEFRHSARPGSCISGEGAGAKQPDRDHQSCNAFFHPSSSGRVEPVLLDFLRI